MHEKLATCVLPVDDLLKEMVEQESLDREVGSLSSRSGTYPVNRLVTLELVTHSKIGKVVRKYISTLLAEREKYGYIYFLNNQRKNMMIPLNIHFQGLDVFSEYKYRVEIASVLDKLASEFACRKTLLYEITLMECFYFYIRLVNPHLTWLATESLLNNVRSHIHLIMSPDRPFPFRTVQESEDRKDAKLAICPRR